MGTALTVANVLEILTTPSSSDPDKVEALLALRPEPRALVVAGWYQRLLEGVSPEEVDDASQRVGRSIEETLDGLADEEFTATIHAMIGVGDTDIVLNMVRGNAGQLSSAVEYLNSAHLEELFSDDPDRDRDDGYDGRLVTLMYTLTVEFGKASEELEEFLSDESGNQILHRLNVLASHEIEDAVEILRFVRDNYPNVSIPSLKKVGDGDEDENEEEI